MLSMLIAYDAAGAVVATLDYVVARDPEGLAIGLVDFGAHEDSGGKLRDIWDVAGAAGSATWPEWIGAAAHDFTVELEAGRLAALVHKQSGHRRERAAIRAAIAEAATATPPGDPVDLRAILGGPNRPLILHRDGHTIGRTKRGTGIPDHLPVVAR